VARSASLREGKLRQERQGERMMKLSEAIRLGAMLGPQAFGCLEYNGATCALGAAYKALGITKPSEMNLGEPFENITCPECGDVGRGDSLVTIAHLNDIHRWTREHIAEQVEIWERELEAQQQAAQPAQVEVPA
jgi:hypothetical protein